MLLSAHRVRYLAVLPMLFVSVSYAESLPIDPNARFTVGLNASANHYAYHQDNEVTVLPQAFYDNNRVYIEGAEAGVYAYKDDKNQWRATLGYDGRDFNAKDADNPALRRLDDRDWSVMAGTSYMRITPVGGFKGQVQTDILGRSDGTAVSLSHLSKFNLMDNKVAIYPELGLTWYDKNYNDYYFGVSDKESLRSGLAKYKADGGVSPYLNISANYRFNPHWSGFISQHLEYLSNEQHDSPLVDNRVDSKTKIGFNYVF